MVGKIKGLLGFCQCDKCWYRSYSIINIKSVNKRFYLCEKHTEEIIQDGKFKSITVSLEE